MLLEEAMENIDEDLAVFWADERQRPLKKFLQDSSHEIVETKALPAYKPKKDDIVIEMVDWSDDETKKGKRIMTTKGECILDEEESEGDTCEEDEEMVDVEGTMQNLMATVRQREKLLPHDFTLSDLLDAAQEGRESIDDLIEYAWVTHVQPEVDALRNGEKTVFEVEDGKYQRILFFLLVMTFQQRFGKDEVEFVHDGLLDMSLMYHWIFEQEVSTMKSAVEQIVNDWDVETGDLVGETKNHARHLPGFWEWFRPFYSGNFRVVKFAVVNILKTDNAKVECAITKRNKSKNAMAMRCVYKKKRDGEWMINTQCFPKPLGRVCYLTIFFLGFFGCCPNYLWSKMAEHFEKNFVPNGRYGHKTWYGKCAIFLLEQRQDVFEYLCRFPFDYRKSMEDHFGISHDDGIANFVFCPNPKTDNPEQYKVKLK